MAPSEIEVAREKRAVASFMQPRGPPPHSRGGYRISRQSVAVLEIRSPWRGPSHERRKSAVAKTTLVRTRNVRRVFWLVES